MTGEQPHSLKGRPLNAQVDANNHGWAIIHAGRVGLCAAHRRSGGQAGRRVNGDVVLMVSVEKRAAVGNS